MLRESGLQLGWHWLDGSFCESNGSDREPGDIDVVSFFVMEQPQAILDSLTTRGAWPPRTAKDRFLSDAYIVRIGENPKVFADEVVYWYSLFSHRRISFDWKGIVEVPFQNDDAEASAALAALESTDADAPA